MVSGLIVGVAWAIWHIPMFFIKGTSQYEQQLEGGLLPAILGYAVFVIAQSVQFTWLFNNTKGSVLLAAVFHGACNVWSRYIDVYRGHFGGILTLAAVFVLVTLIIVPVAGAKDLSCTNKRNVLELENGQSNGAQSRRKMMSTQELTATNKQQALQ